MEEYRTEEEQVEALRRWWQENGRSIIAAVIIALAASFSWQTWESSQEGHQEEASTVYEAMLRAIGIGEASVNAQTGVNLAEQLKQILTEPSTLSLLRCISPRWQLIGASFRKQRTSSAGC